MDLKALLDGAVKDHRAGRLQQAEAAYRRVLSAVPGHVDSLHLLGVVRTQQKAFREGIDLIGRAIALRKTPSAIFHCNIGLAYRGLGERKEAVAQFERALALEPDYVEAHINLAAVLGDCGRSAEAEPHCRRAIALRPDAAAYFALGAVLHDLGKLDEAGGSYRQALNLKPDHVGALLNLGAVLAAQGELDAAIGHYRQALVFRPDNAEAHFNLGAALHDRGDFDEALAEYRRASSLEPDHADAHWNEALLRLARGEYREGFEKFEWRWRRRDYGTPPFAAPQWMGDDLSDRTILLWAEQGFGDSFQCVRYAPFVKARGARTVILQCLPGTEQLMSGVAGIDMVVPRGETPLPAFDCQASLMSLPPLLQADLSGPPANVPYIDVAPALVASFRERVATKAGLKVGLVWRGNPGNTHDRRRSIDATTIAQLCAVPGVSWFSLQLDARQDEIDAFARYAPIEDMSPLLIDWSRTAALLAALDLVVTVDTAVAHLAGALGRPVFVLLAHVAHWCWLRERPDSPWYPTAKLFRQPAWGDWVSPIEAVIHEISRLAAARIDP
ncbi:MAG TPA: tetratricopeptide repeat protein [Alphaproteobacteria bacterium]|nr:tetratricopeptide repeat protein [Alphaproteobacteria bacterium]